MRNLIVTSIMSGTLTALACSSGSSVTTSSTDSSSRSASVGSSGPNSGSSASSSAATTSSSSSGTGGATSLASSSASSSSGAIACELDGGACSACCAQENAAGVEVLVGYAQACICAPNGCESACPALCAALDGGLDGGLDGSSDGGDLGDGGVLASPCESCVSGLLATPNACVTAALIKCDKDTSCKAFTTCEGSCGQ